jgi:hypothetical protein
VKVPGHNIVKGAMDRHPAMIQENQIDCSLSRQIAKHRIPGYTGGTKEQVYLNQTDSAN